VDSGTQRVRLPGTANLFTINGNDYNDPFLNLNNSGARQIYFGRDEIEVMTGRKATPIRDSNGRQAGAQIDYIPSRTNSFHGDGLYYGLAAR